MKEKGSRKWYGITAVSLFLILMFNCGVGYYTQSLFVAPITSSFGVTNGDFAILYSFFGAGSALAAISLHKMLKCFMLRQVIILGGLCSFLGYILFACAGHFFILLTGGLLIGLSTVLAGTATVQISISRWFAASRNLVTGVVASASGVGAAAGSPLVGQCIRHLGWRNACLVIAVLIFVFVCVQVMFLLQEDPGAVCLLPFGAGREASGNLREEGPAGDGVCVREVRSTSRFVLFAVGLVAASVIYQTLSLYQSAMLMERGISFAFAAVCLSVFSMTDICVKITSGFLADRFGFRVVTTCASLAMLGALSMLPRVHTQAGALLFSALLGFWPTMCVLYGVTVSAAVFGKKYLAEYISLTQAIMCCCALFGMPLVRALYNHMGNFSGILRLLSVLTVIFLAVMWRLLRPANDFDRRRSMFF